MFAAKIGAKCNETKGWTAQAYGRQTLGQRPNGFAPALDAIRPVLACVAGEDGVVGRVEAGAHPSLGRAARLSSSSSSFSSSPSPSASSRRSCGVTVAAAGVVGRRPGAGHVGQWHVRDQQHECDELPHDWSDQSRARIFAGR